LSEVWLLNFLRSLSICPSIQLYFLGIAYHYLYLLSNIFPTLDFLHPNLSVFSVLVTHPCFHLNFDVHIYLVCIYVFMFAGIFVCVYVSRWRIAMQGKVKW
jgi:hypothetical protein